MPLTRSSQRAPPQPAHSYRRNPHRGSRESPSHTHHGPDGSESQSDDESSGSVTLNTTASHPRSRRQKTKGNLKTRRSRRNVTTIDSSPRTKIMSSNVGPGKIGMTRQAGKRDSFEGLRINAMASPSQKSQQQGSVQDGDMAAQANIPNWHDPRIPYGFWANACQYAADLDTPTSWLLNTATTCKLFSEPAMTALYRCPSMRHASKAKRLAALIERDPAETYFNYQVKVEYLHIDIHVVPQAILFQLIHSLSRLKEVIFFTSMDQPPYRKLDANIRWQYPEDVFRALNPAPNNTEPSREKQLKSWEWSGSLIGGFVASVQDLCRIHQMPSFSHLTRLSLTNFQVPSLRNLRLKPNDDEGEMQSYHEDGLVIDAVAHAISLLKCLNHLVFESSTILNHRLLPLLPKGLVHLELINCWEITSEDLSIFLHSQGNSLRTLSLMHNQSLNLAFLTDLATACPELRELRMNLCYYRHHDSVNDADPMYDLVLLPSQVPQWPSSIRVIDIEPIRNWSVETAEMFLQSLVDNAQNLPNLRHLVIKTMLDIPWQARAALRGKYGPLVEKVFLRRCESPNDTMSLQQPECSDESLLRRKRKRGSQLGTQSRRSGRIATNASRSSRDGKMLRQQHGKPPVYREPETDVDDDTSEASCGAVSAPSGDSGIADQTAPAVQGLCTTVSIQFDNQKVREWQYSMEDFLTGDDGDSSEEEWDGDDDEFDTAIAF